ncbi:MAG TPA: GNAT family N-acetyltransferase [Alphaproteobacteria bacterium]|jgi:ribosomal-protein-alanine N-acetyltransferase|nr:GNAT family N-acetyltransferase [Alphaproteobacteria bacterium]
MAAGFARDAMAGPVIRAVGREAAELVAALQIASAIEPPWSAASIVELLSTPGCAAFIALAEAGAPPVGFALIRVVAGEAELLSLGVLPGARRQGLGRALIRTAVARAAEGGARTLHLEVAEDNQPALALYRGLGFVPTGRRPGYYAAPAGARRDALLLALALAQA